MTTTTDLTRLQRQMLLEAYRGSGCLHQSPDDHDFNEALLDLYERDLVFPDTRGWWSMTAKGEHQAKIAQLEGL